MQRSGFKISAVLVSLALAGCGSGVTDDGNTGDAVVPFEAVTYSGEGFVVAPADLGAALPDEEISQPLVSAPFNILPEPATGLASEVDPEAPPVIDEADEPVVDAEPVVVAVPAPAPVVAVESEPVVVVEPEPTPEPVAAVEPEATPEPVAAVEPEPTPEPVVVVEPEPTPEPVAVAAPVVEQNVVTPVVPETKTIEISWAAGSASDLGYVIYYHDGLNGDADPVKTLNSASNGINTTDLVIGELFSLNVGEQACFSVSAITANGETSPSDQKCVTY